MCKHTYSTLFILTKIQRFIGAPPPPGVKNKVGKIYFFRDGGGSIRRGVYMCICHCHCIESVTNIEGKYTNILTTNNTVYLLGGESIIFHMKRMPKCDIIPNRHLPHVALK